MVKKITIVRTGKGAIVSVVSGDHVYSEAYESWDQALENVADLQSWAQEMTPVRATQAYATQNA